MSGKKTVLLFAQGFEESLFMKSIKDHCKQYKFQQIKPIYFRASYFFHLEFLVALQNFLPKETVNSISEGAYQKFLHKRNKKPSFWTRLFFNWLAKIYFIKYFFMLKKLTVEEVLVYKDDTILKKAFVYACHGRGIRVNILYKSFKKGRFLIENYSTGFESSIPRNSDFYLKYYTENVALRSSGEAILVLLQKDNSIEILTESSYFKTQEDVLKALMTVSQKCNKKFVVFGAEREYENTHNVFFTTKNYEDFLPFCGGIITCNSIDALMGLEFCRPIILLADAFFNIEGVSFSVNSVEDLVEIIKNLENLPINSKACIGFFNYLQTKSIRCINLQMPSETELDEIVSIW